LTLPSLIDSFLVEVGLDPSGYTKGSKEVAASFGKTKESARSSAKEMEAYGKQSAAFFGKLKTEALGLFLAFAGASTIKSFLSDILDGDASAGRLAKNLGVATQSVSAYRMVVKRLGGEAGDADGALGILAKAREDRRFGGISSIDPELMRLGVTKEDLQDPVKALEQIAKTGEKMKREDYFGLLTRIGIPPGAIESLMKGKRGLQDMVAEQKRHGAATDDDADKAQKWHAALIDIESAIVGFTRGPLYQIIGHMAELTNRFASGKIQLSNYTPEIVALGVAAALIGAPVIALVAALAAIALNYDKIRMALRALRAESGGFRKGINSWLDPINRALGLQTGEEAAAESQKSDDAYAAGRGKGGGAAPPETGGGGAASSGGGQGVAGRAAFIAAYWRQKGYTKEQADGIVAAMRAENDTLMYNNRNKLPAGKGKNAHHAYGLGQWVSQSRRDNFKSQYGHDIEQSNYKEQLDFMAWEMKYGNGGLAVHRSSTAVGAMGSMVNGFYRPGAGTAGDIRRGRQALGMSVSIGAINVNAPNADANAVAARIPAAINQRLNVGLANQALSSG
jgi:hypothetical protein